MKHVYLQVNARSPLTIRSDQALEGAATTPYIPGTTFLGGLAAAHRILLPEKDHEFAALFLNEQVYIPYLYPAVFKLSTFHEANLPVMPLPKTAQTCKRFSGFKPLSNEITNEKRHGIRDSLLDWAVFSLLNKDKEQRTIPTILAPLNAHATCRYDNCKQAMDRVKGYYRRYRDNPKQRMQAKVHMHLQTRTGINRSWGVVEEGILYNREVFDENMRFWGEVILPDELADTFSAFVEEADKEDVIHIGTGLTRGLGHIKIGKQFEAQKEGLASFRSRLENFDEALKEQAQAADVKALELLLLCSYAALANYSLRRVLAQSFNTRHRNARSRARVANRYIQKNLPGYGNTAYYRLVWRLGDTTDERLRNRDGFYFSVLLFPHAGCRVTASTLRTGGDRVRAAARGGVRAHLHLRPFSSGRRTGMNRRMKIIVYVNEQADTKIFYDKSQELGMLAVKSFQEQRSGTKKNQHRAQMTSLENIAETTLKVSDVLDYIKKQTAHQDGWKNEYEGKRFGESLKNYIEHDLDNIRNDVCRNVGIGYMTDIDKRDRQQVYLHLIRQLIRQIVVQYEYEVSELERSREPERRKNRS